MSLLLKILGTLLLATGIYAFVLPQDFFERFAAYTGNFNIHLMRDVGAAYLAAGFAVMWASFVVRWRAPLLCIASAFLLLHAVGHIIDLFRGRVEAAHLLVDAYQVFLPALIIAALGLYFLKNETTH